VPEHLRGIPPFGSKVVFKKSLGTKDRRFALAEKERFLEEVGYHEPARERDRARVEANMRPADHYFEALNSIDASVGQASLIELAGEVQGQLMDPDISQRLRSKLEAQKAAIWKHINAGADNQDDEQGSDGI
jgi:hypothetical protein